MLYIYYKDVYILQLSRISNKKKITGNPFCKTHTFLALEPMKPNKQLNKVSMGQDFSGISHTSLFTYSYSSVTS